jgi:hypothetical protein
MADAFDPAIFTKVVVKYAPWATVQAAVDAILPADIVSADRRHYIARLAPEHLNDWPRQVEALIDNLTTKGLIDDFRMKLFDLSQSSVELQGILNNQIPVGDNGEASLGHVQSIKNEREPFLFNFHELFERGPLRVCAVWIDRQICGTGLLVGPDLVLTARHVLRDQAPSLIQETAVAAAGAGGIRSRDSQVAGSHRRLAFLFDYRTMLNPLKIDPSPQGITVVRAAETWLEWSSQRHPKDGNSHSFGEPDVKERLDCAVVRLERRIGLEAARHAGGGLRGWEQLNGTAPRFDPNNIISIFQHPAGGPQAYGQGRFRDQDAAKTRIFYWTETAGGSSGSPCFDSDTNLVAFHNAGRPADHEGTTADCNQGVRIDHVIAAITAQRPTLIAESQKPLESRDTLWTASGDAATPVPILGRTEFKKSVLELLQPGTEQRVIVVADAQGAANVSGSGKSFSSKILRAVARTRPCLIVEFRAEDIKRLAPEEFLRELARQIGLTEFGSMPAKPEDERQATRWWANDLPYWFGQQIEQRAQATRFAVVQPVADAEKGAARGKELLPLELIWIVIDDIHRHPPEGGLRELLAGLMGVTDTQHVLGPGLKALRWLVIGHVPDFVREKSIQHGLDEVSQTAIGLAEWKECITMALLSQARGDLYNEEMADLLFEFTMSNDTSVKDPKTVLAGLQKAVIGAIEALRSRKTRTTRET